MFIDAKEDILLTDYCYILEKELMNQNINIEKLLRIIPELKEMLNYKESHPAHKFNILEHTLEVVRRVPNKRVLKLAALFHDIGKPYQKINGEDGKDYFWGRREVGELVSKEIRRRLGYNKYINITQKDNYFDYLLGHEEIGSLISKEIMIRLGFSDDIIGSVTRLILYHDYIISAEEYAVKFAAEKIGQDIFGMLLELQEADIMAHSEQFIARKLPMLQETKKIYKLIQKTV